ncbi:MAG: hypothetical protein HY058_08630 [Proteobacteria bacterium]|nr:hypothetical protein [Pseudomonadota bacterium]
MPEQFEVTKGLDPWNEDKDVRFRTTYYFRVFDVCELVDRNSSIDPGQNAIFPVKTNQQLQLLKDSIYRFRMTGQASSLFNRVHFESGTLKAAEIDPFGATIAQDDRNGQLYFKSRDQVEEEARETAQLKRLKELRTLLGEVKDGDKDPIYPDLLGLVRGQIREIGGGPQPPAAVGTSNEIATLAADAFQAGLGAVTDYETLRAPTLADFTPDPKEPTPRASSAIRGDRGNLPTKADGTTLGLRNALDTVGPAVSDAAMALRLAGFAADKAQSQLTEAKTKLAKAKEEAAKGQAALANVQQNTATLSATEKTVQDSLTSFNADKAKADQDAATTAADVATATAALASAQMERDIANGALVAALAAAPQVANDISIARQRLATAEEKLKAAKSALDATTAKQKGALAKQQSAMDNKATATKTLAAANANSGKAAASVAALVAVQTPLDNAVLAADADVKNWQGRIDGTVAAPGIVRLQGQITVAEREARAMRDKIVQMTKATLDRGAVSALVDTATASSEDCPRGSTKKRGFQVLGPEGVRTFNQDERLVMAMSSDAKPLISVLKDLSSRVLDQKANASDQLLPIATERLHISEAQRALDAAKPKFPDDVAPAVQKVIEAFLGQTGVKK